LFWLFLAKNIMFFSIWSLLFLCLFLHLFSINHSISFFWLSLWMPKLRLQKSLTCKFDLRSKSFNIWSHIVPIFIEIFNCTIKGLKFRFFWGNNLLKNLLALHRDNNHFLVGIYYQTFFFGNVFSSNNSFMDSSIYRETLKSISHFILEVFLSFFLTCYIDLWKKLPIFQINFVLYHLFYGPSIHT